MGDKFRRDDSNYDFTPTTSKREDNEKRKSSKDKLLKTGQENPYCMVTSYIAMSFLDYKPG